MPIGGFVISLDLPAMDEVLAEFKKFPEVEVYGVDEQGQVVAVIDTETFDQMEQTARRLQNLDGVLSVGATYLHAEDEIEKVRRGELPATFSMGRKGEKPTQRA